MSKQKETPEQTAIEDRLHRAGYKTERVGDVVNVHDPIHSAVPVSNTLILTGWKLKEIRSSNEAWAFIEERK